MPKRNKNSGQELGRAAEQKYDQESLEQLWQAAQQSKEGQEAWEELMRTLLQGLDGKNEQQEEEETEDEGQQDLSGSTFGNGSGTIDDQIESLANLFRGVSTSDPVRSPMSSSSTTARQTPVSPMSSSGETSSFTSDGQKLVPPAVVHAPGWPLLQGTADTLYSQPDEFPELLGFAEDAENQGGASASTSAVGSSTDPMMSALTGNVYGINDSRGNTPTTGGYDSSWNWFQNVNAANDDGGEDWEEEEELESSTTPASNKSRKRTTQDGQGQKKKITNRRKTKTQQQQQSEADDVAALQALLLDEMELNLPAIREGTRNAVVALTDKVLETVEANQTTVAFSPDDVEQYPFIVDFERRVVICNIRESPLLAKKWNPLKVPRSATNKAKHAKSEANEDPNFNETYGRKLKRWKRTQSNRAATRQRHEFLATQLQRVVINQLLLVDDVLDLLGMKRAIRRVPGVGAVCDMHFGKKRDRNRVNASDHDPSVIVIVKGNHLVYSERIAGDALNPVLQDVRDVGDGKGISVKAITGPNDQDGNGWLTSEHGRAFDLLYATLDRARQRDSIVYALCLLAQHRYGFHLILHQYCLIGFALAAFCHSWNNRTDKPDSAKDVVDPVPLGEDFGLIRGTQFRTDYLTKETWYFVQNGNIITLGPISTKVPLLVHTDRHALIEHIKKCRDADERASFDLDPVLKTLYAPSHEVLKQVILGEVPRKEPAASDCYVAVDDANAPPVLKRKFVKRRNVDKALLDYLTPSNFRACDATDQVVAHQISDSEEEDSEDEGSEEESGEEEGGQEESGDEEGGREEASEEENDDNAINGWMDQLRLSASSNEPSAASTPQSTPQSTPSQLPEGHFVGF